MQGPQMNRYESLVQKALKPNTESYPQFTYDPHPFQPNMQELLNNIEEINVSRSYSIQPLKDSPQTLKMKSNPSSQQTLSCEWGDSRTFRSQKTMQSKSSKRSLIFASQKFTKTKPRKSNSHETLTIYYFDLPVRKTIKFSSTTTMADLIYQAIEMYLTDDSLDHTKIRQRHHLNYQLRMLASEEQYKADLKVPAISYDRKVADNMFDCLVLRIKEKKDRKYSEAEPISFISKNYNKNTVTIYLSNQLGQELGTLNMNCSDSLEKIFDHIQSNDLHNMRTYYLSQSKNDIDGLPRDFQVKNLESNKIYIKAKKYIDEADYQSRVRPLRQLSLISKEIETNIQMPIGLSEASQYQEYSVIKINSMGFEQQRVLGIDQTKIYNYDKSYRQEKRQPSFLDKIFGINQETGTKKPFRLISDIVNIQKTQKGLCVIYKQKSIFYLVPDIAIRDTIYRKLFFLVGHNSKQEKISSNKKKN